jgi:hypothetical protein
MTTALRGGCPCGNIKVVFETALAPTPFRFATFDAFRVA